MSQKILIVEDSPTILGALSDNLSEAGYAVSTAVSGEDAVEAARNTKFDYVVTDTVLPGINGWEVCKTLKAEHPGIKVVITTAKVDAVSAEKARDAGADDCCVTTSDFSMIAESIEKLKSE